MKRCDELILRQVGGCRRLGPTRPQPREGEAAMACSIEAWEGAAAPTAPGIAAPLRRHASAPAALRKVENARAASRVESAQNSWTKSV